MLHVRKAIVKGITKNEVKALVCTEPGKFEYISKAKPCLEKENAIIKIIRIGICGTDLHAYEGTQPFFEYPRILGHELSGELIEFDDATGFEKGEPVTFIPYFNCCSCIACRMGKPNCCINIKVCGVHIDGGMTEYLSVPSHSLVHGNELSYDELALVEPLAVGAHGVNRANVTAGEFVLVIGAGPIGLAIMEFARIAGGNVIAVDVKERRLQFSRDNLNIAHTINATSENVVERLQTITNGDMPTVVIDATGNSKAINNAFQYMAHGGRYVLVGLQKGDISFSHPEFHKREATLMSSRNATRKDYNHVIDCIKKKKINPTAFITDHVVFDNAEKEFENWLKPESNIIKVMVDLNT